jgi:hypothetical protein
MVPTEHDRARIEQKLGSHQAGRWIAVKSELQRFGKQTLFWFLIEDPRQIGEIIGVFRKVAADELARFDQTEFELSFIQISDGKSIVWDVVDNDEIHGTLPARTWGEHPAQFHIGEDDLFSEYVGKT